MTRQELKKKWLVITFFLSVSLIFIYFIHFLATGSYDPTQMRWVTKTEAGNALHQGEGNFLLQKNQEFATGRMKITYLGIDAQALVIDLVLMDLDPYYAYRHRIPTDAARQGFYLSEVHFRASSLTPTAVRLERRP